MLLLNIKSPVLAEFYHDYWSSWRKFIVLSFYVIYGQYLDASSHVILGSVLNHSLKQKLVRQFIISN